MQRPFLIFGTDKSQISEVVTLGTKEKVEDGSAPWVIRNKSSIPSMKLTGPSRSNRFMVYHKVLSHTLQ